ncbi:MAG: flagellar hook-length control protein FliK, partial [Oscillospiraceae bacterium]|nr:flagellar hook-length control protein FliK [Oscillospiraceae bacterium]
TQEIREKTQKEEITSELRAETHESDFGSETESENSNSSAENGMIRTEARPSEHVNSQAKDDESVSDFEKLVQGAVTLTPFNFINTDSMMSDHLAERQIAHQTYRALDESIIKNRKHFVIRLNPEGLGEITVRLIKSESSVLVKMIASDRKTAALLNRDLDVLQDQLKVHNAEIETVEYRKPEDALQNMMSGGQEYRNSSEETGHRNGQARNTENFADDTFEEDETSVEMMPSILGGTILNRFI